jgi:hypothetical protein
MVCNDHITKGTFCLVNNIIHTFKIIQVEQNIETRKHYKMAIHN